MKTTLGILLLCTVSLAFASGPKERFAMEKSPELGKKIRYDRELISWTQTEYPASRRQTVMRHYDAFLVGGDGQFADFSFSIPYQGEDLKSTTAELITPQGKTKKVSKDHLTHRLMSTFELYSDAKLATWSLSNIEVGSIVCIECSIESREFEGCGYSYLQDMRWDVDSTIAEFIPPPAWRARLIPEAVVPGSVKVDGNCLYAGKLARWEERPFDGDFACSGARFSYEILPADEDASPETWSDVSAKWIKRWGELDNGIGRLHYVSQLPLALDSLCRRFEHDFRYVAIELGEGGRIPHVPADVLKNRYGDCKDLSFFLCNALREQGMEIYPVLVRVPANEPFMASYPNDQFNHCITAIVRGPDTLYYDPTADGFDLGVLPSPDRGAYALWLKEGSSLTRLPKSLADVPLTRTLTGQLAKDGTFTGTLTIDYRYLGRSMAAQFADRKAMEQEVRRLLRKNYAIDFQQITVDENQRTLTADLTLSDYARTVSGSLYCTPYPFPAERDSVSENLLGGYYVNVTRPVRTTVTITLPEGVAAPHDSAASPQFSTGQSSMNAKTAGNILTVDWGSQFSHDHFPPESKPQLDSLLHTMNRQQSLVVKLPVKS